jgi:hypothetical protein
LFGVLQRQGKRKAKADEYSKFAFAAAKPNKAARGEAPIGIDTKNASVPLGGYGHLE